SLDAAVRVKRPHIFSPRYGLHVTGPNAGAISLHSPFTCFQAGAYRRADRTALDGRPAPLLTEEVFPPNRRRKRRWAWVMVEAGQDAGDGAVSQVSQVS
ncbi:MAG TPA: hypothetical protein VGZ47_20960, partial [Gemmataceae bacterium]|nr:hypothetical protein [Gemmataceae bacterium]